MADRAVELDPDSSDARVTLAKVKTEAYDWPRAEEEYRRAIALNPNNASAHHGFCFFLDDMGRLDEGWKECQIAQDLDPNGDHLSLALEVRGQYDRAVAIVQTLLKREGEHAALRCQLYRLYTKKGMYKEAVQELEKMLTLCGFPDAAASIHHAFATSGYRGAMRQTAAEFERLEATKRLSVPIFLAEVHTALGDKDRAFYWLEAAYKRRNIQASGTYIDLSRLKVARLLDPLRSEPRFKDLLRRVGLPL
jgi:tetratricopeptide (TPR) repeat protein